MNRITIVQSVIRKIRAKNYLEIGVSYGHAFLSIDAQHKIAVDPKNLLRHHAFARMDDWILEVKKIYRALCQALGMEKALFFEVPSDDFFAREKALLADHPIDAALIDGLHTYGQVLRDVENSLKHLSPNGVLVLHDCNPASSTMETPAGSFAEAEALNAPDWDKLWCGDVWKAIVHLRSTRKDLQIFVFDCDMGVGIVKWGTPENPLDYTPDQIKALNYGDLEKNRAHLLNLKPVSYFKEFLSSL